MPHIFDNIEQSLLPVLRQTLDVSYRADFCVGYFNLRGWKELDSHIEAWSGGDGNRCRLLVGMQRLPQDELRAAAARGGSPEIMDLQTQARLKRRLAEEFREQLTIGMPTDEDEAGLRRLAAQIRGKKVQVKLFLRHTLHAKLYLLFSSDPLHKMLGYVGSSNLTLAGLAHQGELNVDVPDEDACLKLAKWFEERWNDHWCVDISEELAKVIEESWAREHLIPPYYIYVKMAYHLSQEAREGVQQFRIPKQFGNKLFAFQTAAVKLAARHVNQRGGVLIGDVVGLGKTLMATALARIFEDDWGVDTLIICPKNLVKMWEDYRQKYGLRALVLSSTQAIQKLPEMRRYRVVIIDESHNLRNREGKRYRAIQDYLRRNESQCILLSATPYNKSYLDLSSQLRLFIPEDRDLGVRPEKAIREMGEARFVGEFQCPVRSLAAFEHSPYPEDWRELMRLYMVRRTRTFIKENYALPREGPDRKYLLLEDGTPSYFPDRVPRTVTFNIDESDPTDQYARLYSDAVVAVINALQLPRYGLGNYRNPKPDRKPSAAEARTLDDLSRAGKRLMGFCRTNLFKRLESSGSAFIQSIERHILRNYVYLHAIEEGLDLPIGTQNAEFLEIRAGDEDPDAVVGAEEQDSGEELEERPAALRTEEQFRRSAATVYAHYSTAKKRQFKWLSPRFFTKTLARDLRDDAIALLGVLNSCGEWRSDRDTKLRALLDLLTQTHPMEKMIVFTQFADTVRYLETELKARGLQKMEGVTGDSEDPTGTAWKFSPISNDKRKDVKPEDELRVLVATDVLSEGQNLQDCAIVVNYDLPWAIIRLVQRAGRVDRIGQKSDTVLCYSFLPADGVERILNLRGRVRQRLKQNAEVVGADEAFFEDDGDGRVLIDLYNEKVGVMDEEPDTEVDLASYAYQIWRNAVQARPELERAIPALPSVVYSTRQHEPGPNAPDGVLVYMRTGEGSDALAWVDSKGNSVTESQYAILKAAECSLATPALPRRADHHELVRDGVEMVAREERSAGGHLGSRAGARSRSYERLMSYAERMRGTMFEIKDLTKAIDEIYRFPLQERAKEKLNRQLRVGISEEELVRLVLELWDDDRLCVVQESEEAKEPRIICSLGLSTQVEVR